MNAKDNFPLIILLFSFLFLSQGCSVVPQALEPTPLPTQTDAPPAATFTPLPPTLTPLPPTPTPTREAITVENIQRLLPVWEFPVPDDSFRAVAFSPDGQRLAAGTGQNTTSPDQKLRLLEVSTGQLLAESEKVEAIIWDLAFSPKGSYIAAALDNGIVQIRGPWDLHQIDQFYFPGPVNSLSISPDGSKMAAGVADNGTGTVYILDLTSGEVILRIDAHTYSVADMDFSPDGSLLATGAVDREVKIWDTATGELIHRLPLNSQGSVVSFSQDGGLLASGGCGRSENTICQEGGVFLWSTTTWDVFRDLSGAGAWVEGLAFSDSNDLLAGVDRSGILYFWSVKEGVILRSLRISSYATDAVAISANGRYLAAGSAYNLSLLAIGQ